MFIPAFFQETILDMSAIICFAIAVSGLTEFKQMIKSGGFNATGSASRDFVSDLIVWRGEFSVSGPTTKVGELLNANLGVFQITGQNSDSDEYSYGGTFNTTSKGKTASITVKLNYTIR